MNSLPPLPLVDGTLFMDNSGFMEALNTCPRSLQYRQLSKRIPVAESAALNFGSAIHLALEYRYRHYQTGPIDLFYEDSILPILTEFFELHPPPIEDGRNLNWALELLRKYNEKYSTEPFSLLSYDEPVRCSNCNGTGETTEDKLDGRHDVTEKCSICAGECFNKHMVELPFAIPLFFYNQQTFQIRQFAGDYGRLPHEILIVYTGRIDLPILEQGKLYVMDHKTTSMLGSSFFEEKKMSPQFKGYCYAFQKLTGKAVQGYQINAIRTKEPPGYVRDGVESKYGRAGKDKMTPEKWWAETLQRQSYDLKPYDLEEWLGNTTSIIEEFFWNYNRGFLPQKMAWCVGKYGKCAYFDTCNGFPNEREAYLASGLFTDNLWTPLKAPSQSKQ